MEFRLRGERELIPFSSPFIKAMSKNKQGEKAEEDEKDLIIQEKMDRVMSAAGKWRRDKLGSVIWAVILIWIGLAILASNVRWRDAINNFLAQLRFQVAETPLAAPVSQLSPWSLIFLGAGVILLVEVVIRLSISAHRRPVLGTIVLALILLGIGLNSWIMIWPMVIIVIILAVVFRGRFGSK